MSLSRIGRYEIEKELGRGAMAVVHKALDPLIGRTVAIKTIRLEHGAGMEEAELKTRLYREARSAGVLNHPNIVTIYDIGEEGDIAYIAMEFIEGETLDSWLTAHPIPPVDVTVSIIEQIAAGLDYAASKGIIHRDVKPGNILLTQDLRAKIADFGIAKFSMSKLTMTGMVMGTPSYMSPEQAMGQELDGRSDMFSLGIMFYQMLTGERPFVGNNPTTIIYKILHEQPVSPKMLNVTLHPGLDYIVTRMLMKDPAARYQSSRELITDLKNYHSLGQSTGSHAAVLTTGSMTAANPTAQPVQAAEVPQTTVVLPQRSYLLPTLLVIFVLAAAGIGYYVLSRTKPAAVTQTQPPPATEQAKTPSRPPEPVKPPPEPPANPATTVAAKTPPVQPPPERPAPAPAFVSLASAAYSARVMDGSRKLDLKPGGDPVAVGPGEHKLRVIAEDVYLDRPLEPVKLKSGQTHTIALPGLGSAYIEVPNDAYDGCEILLNGKLLPPPYPAQVPKVAAGNNRVLFRWNSGKYAGKQANTVVTIQEKGHFLIKGEPETGGVQVQQVR
jgi:eukaryotic-like serine/threonine-protein kinase